MRRELSKYDSRLGSVVAKRMCLLNPTSSKFLPMWDAIQALALIYTSIMTPFEVAFLEVPTTAMDPWFLVNRALDVIFISDMVLQFFVMYRAKIGDEDAVHSHGRLKQLAQINLAKVAVATATKSTQPTSGSNNDEVIWVASRQRIALHYLTGWFIIDVASVGASAFDFPPLFVDDTPEGLANLKTLRVVRVLRLVKLVRLVRASRVVARMASRVALSYRTLTMISNTATLMIVAHWAACIFALQAAMHESPSESWLGVYGYCDGPGGQGGPFAPPWVQTLLNASGVTRPTRRTIKGEYDAWTIECSGLTLSTWYIASLSWSIMIITGTGGTDAYPSSTSTTETTVVLIMVLVGALIWTQLLASFCSVATK